MKQERGFNSALNLLSLVAVSNDSMGGVIRGNTYLNSIPLYHANSVFFHSAGENGPHNDIIVALNFHATATQNLGDYTLQLDEIFSSQDTPFMG